ncbi:MAG TPA: GxxExxY protein [Pyrinomonadaceae bacterium]|nr:GxxExxY protein [Pyrinomonadaceae bacterium]
MNTDDLLIFMSEDELNKISETIIGCSYAVGNALGNGFLEKVYENALAFELIEKNLNVKQQHPINVYYKNRVVGEYIADLLVENKVIVELKTVKGIDEIHLAQCLNYLKATNLPLCLLINFGKPRVEVKRVFQSVNLRNIFKVN